MDRLFSLPLKSFVAERQSLAKELRRAGHRDAAARVEALPRPTVSAWTLNQLVREDRRAVDDVLAALEAIRDAQLQGSGDAAALREASRLERESLGRLAEASRAVLTNGGQSAGRDVIDRAQRAVRAAAMHAEGRERLLAGRLVVDYEDGGFDALASLATTRIADAPAPLAPRASAAPSASPRDVTPAARTPDLEAVARETERRAREAERRALDDAIASARKKLVERRAVRDALEATAIEARDMEAAARRTLEAVSKITSEAETRLAGATREVDEARTSLAELVRTLAEAEPG